MGIEFIEGLKQQWMAMIDATDDPLVVIDADYNILRQNVAYVRNSKNAKERSIREFFGEKCYEIFADRSEPCSHCQVYAAINSAHAVTWSTKELFDNREVEIRAHVLLRAPSEDPYEPLKLVIHYRDVTEQKLLQDKLAQADKLTAIGKLAGGVAHEINSPLAGILAFTQMLLKEVPEGDPHRNDLLEIEEGARKCKVIVESLLGFSRQSKTDEISDVDIFEIIRSTTRLAAPLIRKNSVNFILNIPQERAIVAANAGKLSQVVLNLLTNAIYSMKNCGGLLEISSQIEYGNIKINISDQGEGIDPKNIKQIFDPFFTTKPVGEGTGLGLSISYSIVKHYGGDITVSSIPDVGSVFTIVLPLKI